jgi:SAM-dependent methyltransferase
MKPLYDFSSLAVDRTVSSSDTMFVPGREEQYFQIGRRALELTHFSSELCRKPHYPNILDLGCGYGRVLRWLRPQYHYAEITACDLEPAAVDFCARHFGATPVHSQPDLESLSFRAPFDLIWCGSVLTHLNPTQWLATLDSLIKWTNECGVVIFTTQGRYFASALARNQPFVASDVDQPALLADFERTGFAYQQYFDRHDGDYGITLNSPEWLMRTLQRYPGVIVRSFIEEAWGMQDVTILYKSSEYFSPVLGRGAQLRV